jgi:cobalt-zinc-cadmium resistance protein CzcA
MLTTIIQFSIKQKLIIGLLVIALIGYGSYELTQLPIDAVPDITNNQVQVITVAPALGATDIERLITFPIELANSNISGLHEIRSFSRFGLSLVTIVFDDGVDIYWARQQVAERLLQVKNELPRGFGTVSLGPVTTGLGEIYQYTVRAKEGYENKYNAMELRTIQDWIVRRQLLGVKGVAEVSSFGGKLKQYEVAVDPGKLKSYNLTINDVFEALEGNNQNTGGAYIEKGPTVLYIRSEGLVGSIEDIKTIFLRNTSSGTPLLMRDVADIRFGNATRYGAMCYNDQGEVAGAVVMMLKGENSSEVINNIKNRVVQIQKSLPEGVIMEPFLDRTKMVNQAIKTVETNLLEGALIVLFVLILFLGNIRAGLLVASVIPLSMLVAVILMNLFGVSGNLMSLGALDFGLIIDGAVISVEALLHSLSHSKRFKVGTSLNSSEMDEEVKKSASRMMNSAVFGQLIILVVYLPIFFLEGIEGKMFKPMVQTVVFALIGAFILSLTYVPMMSALVMNKNATHKKSISDKMMEFIERKFQHILFRVLRFPKLVLGAVIGLFIVSIWVLSAMGGEFIPAIEEGDFAVETRVLPGSNLNTTIESTQNAARILKAQFPEVEQVVTKIGSGEIPSDPMPMEAADLMIILKDKNEWTSAKTFPELSEKMSKALAEVPGITVSFQFPVQMRFNELMTGAKQDVVCKIFGENIDTLAYYARQLGQLASSVAGTKNVYVEPVNGLPQVLIEYNRAAIAQYGLNISDINRVVNASLAGQSAGFVYEGEMKFDLVVRLKTEQRNNMDDIKNLLIPTHTGDQIPLNQLANIELKDGPNQIQREDAKRRIIVGFNVGDRDVQSIVEELQNKVEKNLRFPPGYYITYGGAFENLNAAKARLGITVPIALFLIFILLYFSFRSIKQGLLIYSAIPLSAIGGILALSLREMPFSISAGVGFIALFGVAVLNGIVLLAEFNRLKLEGMNNTFRIVLMGTKIRLRPVLMTAFVASLGFLPMALSNGAGAEVQRPLATVVIGGLLIATFLTLFVLPILYTVFEGTSRKVKIPSVGKGFLLSFVFFAASNALFSQPPISLKASIDTAIANNQTVKNERLKAEYQKQLIKSATNIPQTNITGQFGQVNSIYTDKLLGISQGFSFPTVYANQKALLNEEWKSSVLSIAVKEAELKKQVTQVYYTLLFLSEKLELLKQNDSLYSEFLKKANIRFAAGETSILEKTTAEVQRGQIAIQLDLLNLDYMLLLSQFDLLLNAGQQYVPYPTDLKIDHIPSLDTVQSIQHPLLVLLQQREMETYSFTKLEKSKNLPNMSLGYYNMSMRGNGADNHNYGSAFGFQSVQIGLSIPVFFSAQAAKVRAAKVNQLVSANYYRLEQQLMNKQRAFTIKQIANFKEHVYYFESSALKNAETIITTANQQFRTGDINYLDWVMLINQAISIKSDYLDAVHKLNRSTIDLNYFSNNN